MLGELAVFEAHNIGGDPSRRTAVAGKAPVRDNLVSFGKDHVIFVAERAGKAADKIEQGRRGPAEYGRCAGRSGPTRSAPRQRNRVC